MRKGLYTLLLLLLCNAAGAQDIGDFFKMIPLRNYYGYLGYLSVEQKDSLLRNGPQEDFDTNQTDGNRFILSALDYKNGYLSVHTDGSEYMEMCMWKCNNYKETGIPARIVAVAYTSPDTNGTNTDYLDIFLYWKNTLCLISDEFEQMQMRSNFFKDGVDFYEFRSNYDYYILYELPRQGRNLKMHIIMPDGEMTDRDLVRKILSSMKGDILNITLDEYGSFTKGKLMKSDYFEEVETYIK